MACTTSGLAVQLAPLIPLSPTESGKWCRKLVVPPPGRASKRSGATSGAAACRAVLPGRVEDAAAAGNALAAVLGGVEQVQVVERLRRPGTDGTAEAVVPATSHRRDV